MSDFLNHHIILKFHITQIQQRGNQATGPHIGISNNALQLQIFSFTVVQFQQCLCSISGLFWYRWALSGIRNSAATSI